MSTASAPKTTCRPQVVGKTVGLSYPPAPQPFFHFFKKIDTNRKKGAIVKSSGSPIVELVEKVKQMSSIKMEIEIQDNELAEAVYENIFGSNSSWCFEFSWDSENPTEDVPVKYENPIEDGVGNSTVTIEMLTNALQILIEAKQTCWGIPITVDFEQWDANMADMVFQQAIFGEVVYG